jgi:hypothetical protein
MKQRQRLSGSGSIKMNLNRTESLDLAVESFEHSHPIEQLSNFLSGGIDLSQERDGQTSPSRRDGAG